MRIYLHYWHPERRRWTTEEEEKATNYAGICLPDDPLTKEYPGGYKFWKARRWDEAPPWVHALVEEH